MFTRRKFLAHTAGAGAGLALATHFPRDAIAQASLAERNKQVVLAYKAEMKVKPRAVVEEEFVGPGYKRTRLGLQNLANNAEGQGFPGNGEYLRGGIPDRNHIVEEKGKRICNYRDLAS